MMAGKMISPIILPRIILPFRGLQTDEVIREENG